MSTYTTRNEAIAEIITAIEAGDAIVSEYDIDAIADEVITTTDRGLYQVETDGFWDAVMRHQH